MDTFEENFEATAFNSMYRILGVEQFIFYITSADEDALKVLRFYQKQKIVTLKNFNLPYSVIGDCGCNYLGVREMDTLYRTRYHFNYLVQADMDELLIPNQHPTYGQLFQYIATNNSVAEHNISSYIFHYAMFPAFLQGDSVYKNSTATYLISLHKTTRDQHVEPYHRTKFIVNPSTVDEIDTHRPRAPHQGKIATFICKKTAPHAKYIRLNFVHN